MWVCVKNRKRLRTRSVNGLGLKISHSHCEPFHKNVALRLDGGGLDGDGGGGEAGVCNRLNFTTANVTDTDGGGGEGGAGEEGGGTAEKGSICVSVPKKVAFDVCVCVCGVHICEGDSQ